MGSMRIFKNDGLAKTDLELYNLIRREKLKQLQSLELIASENYASYSSLQCISSCLNNKYSKMIHKKTDGDVEVLCEERCLKVFGLHDQVWGANVRAYSGAIANLGVYMALCSPGDRIMGLEYLEGGHYTHGYMKAKQKLSAVSLFFETFPYRIDPKTGLIDYNKLAELARLYSPKVIIAGVCCYSRCLDYSKFREIADEVGAFLVGDMAHVSGLVATGLIPSPLDYCHVVTTSTYKSLRGTRGSIIFYRKKVKMMSVDDQTEEFNLETRINNAVFPGIIGGPMMNAIAGIATTMKEVTTPAFERYQIQVLLNAKRFCSKLQSLGYTIVTGGTDIHMMLLSLKSKGISGQQAEFILEEVNISCTTFPVPGDKPGSCSNGLRIGTPALTTRGCIEVDFDQVTHFFDTAINIAVETKAKTKSESFDDFKNTARQNIEIAEKIEMLKTEISRFAENFPIPGLDDL